MKEIKRELSKELYEKLIALSYVNQEKELWPDGVPDDWYLGYGYYGHRIYELCGKYYAEFVIGDSCD